MELKISSCIWDVDFELLNTEFIVDLCLVLENLTRA